MSQLRVRTVRTAIILLAALAAGSAPAHAYDERPMQSCRRRVARAPRPRPRASAQPAGWLVAASPAGAARAAALAPRFGAHKLRTGAVYRVATVRARAFAAALRAVGALRYAEPNAVLARQSALDAAPTGYARGYVVDPSLTPPAPGAVTIAVIDDLADITHPDLAGHTTQANPGPVLGPHGTEVASAAAGAFNGFGVTGVFPGASVLSIGLPPEITCADAANGIVAASRAGAKVINLSIGSPSDCTTLFGAVEIAFARGCLVVAASGNEFGAGNPVIFPAAYPHVLSVASLNASLAPSFFSTSNAAVDVAAPGVDIPVARPAAFDTEDGVVDGITLASGTSFAAPIVSGAAAWLATVRPDLSNGQLADTLRRSARDIAPPGYDTNTGFGLVNLAAALALPAPARDSSSPTTASRSSTARCSPSPTRTSGAAPASARSAAAPTRSRIHTTSTASGCPALARADPAAPGLRQPQPVHLPRQRAVDRPGPKHHRALAQDREEDRLRDDPQPGRRGAALLRGDQRRQRRHRPQRLVQPQFQRLKYR